MITANTYPPECWDCERVSFFVDLCKGANVVVIEMFYDGELHLEWEGMPWERSIGLHVWVGGGGLDGWVGGVERMEERVEGCC